MKNYKSDGMCLSGWCNIDLRENIIKKYTIKKKISLRVSTKGAIIKI